jgi:hypothetical protein
MSEPNPTIAKPSDLVRPAAAPRSAAPVSRAVVTTGGGAALATRPLPAPMHLDLGGGEIVELTEDQVFADRVVVRAGERGTALYPSSQAASWVVRFPRVGSKLRVVPERLLRIAE